MDNGKFPGKSRDKFDVHYMYQQLLGVNKLEH